MKRMTFFAALLCCLAMVGCKPKNPAENKTPDTTDLIVGDSINEELGTNPCTFMIDSVKFTYFTTTFKSYAEVENSMVGQTVFNKNQDTLMLVLFMENLAEWKVNIITNGYMGYAYNQETNEKNELLSIGYPMRNAPNRIIQPNSKCLVLGWNLDLKNIPSGKYYFELDPSLFLAEYQPAEKKTYKIMFEVVGEPSTVEPYDNGIPDGPIATTTIDEDAYSCLKNQIFTNNNQKLMYNDVFIPYPSLRCERRQVYIVRSQEELQKLCPDTLAAPAIDFSKNCILFSFLTTPSIIQRLLSSELNYHKNQDVFVLDVNISDYGDDATYPDAIGFLFPFGVYPLSPEILKHVDVAEHYILM